jgi:hypothetical protein
MTKPNQNFQLKRNAILWGLAAIALSIFFCTVNNSPLVLHATLFTKVLAVCAGAVLGTVLTLIADALRRFAHPDVIFTNGGFFSLLWAKVFWKVGPQLIGLFIGVAVGVAIVLK